MHQPMPSNKNLFAQKDIVCPICSRRFVHHQLTKTQFSLKTRDIDYRPIFMGPLSPRSFAILVCPHCLYAGELKYFCPKISEAEMRQKQAFADQKEKWEASNRVKAASAGQQLWKDLASEKLKTLNPADVPILQRITPLLQKVVGTIPPSEKPLPERIGEGDPFVMVKAYELAAVCYKARKASPRVLGYTYLSGAWASRDACEQATDEGEKEVFDALDKAYLREAVGFLSMANQATSAENQHLPDGTMIPKEVLPQSRIFEILFILAGAHRLLGEFEKSDAFLEQLLFAGAGEVQGYVLWFIQQAKEMRQEKKSPRPLANAIVPVEPAEAG